ncbi:2-hydroxyacid dehydrogenase [Virgibacillus sp. W0181]|uniref:2-hydroxyacid dehydrogenase n=1 Tax=Virgibacillus sp. W0181 TaxID=3391581 RepID=UPI003F46F9BD
MEKIIAYTRVSKSIREQLQEKFDVIYFEKYEHIDDPFFIETLQETVGIIGLQLEVTEELLQLAPNLKIVSNVSVGYDNLDIDALTERNIMATNTPDVSTNTVADAVCGIMLATARRISELDTFVKNGEWKEYLQLNHFGTDVHHKTIGIIGMGRIGEAIAKRCHLGFDMTVLYHNRSRKEQVEQRYNAIYCQLDTLLEESDFVCLMIPFTRDMKRMIGENEFKRMKRSAIFINASRGKNVDELALYNALKNEDIAAAGLDVFDQEPVAADNPLLKLKNVVTLPHIGTATTENELAMSSLAAKNLETGLLGYCPPNIINPEVCKNI